MPKCDNCGAEWADNRDLVEALAKSAGEFVAAKIFFWLGAGVTVLIAAIFGLGVRIW